MSNRQRSEILSISSVDLDRLLNQSRGIMTAAAALDTAGARMSSSAPVGSATARSTEGFVAPSAIRVAELVHSVRAASRAENADEIKTAVRGALASAGLYTLPGRLDQAVASLQAATSARGAVRQAALLFDAAIAAHSEVFFDALESQVAAAAADAGFTDVSSRKAAPDTRRVFATDAAGAGIAIELRSQPGGATTMECEVVGQAEPQCGRSLAAFTAALKARGVRSDDGPVVPVSVPSSEAATILAGRLLARERRESAGRASRQQPARSGQRRQRERA